MKKLDNFKKNIKHNYWKGIGLLLSAISLFVYLDEYLNLLNFILVNPLMSRLEHWAYPLLALVAISIYYYFLGFSIKKQSTIRLCFVFCITTIYIVCILSDKWKYFGCCDGNIWLVYANVYLLVPICESIIFIRNVMCNRKVLKKDVYYFALDIPLEPDKEIIDDYNRIPIFQSLVREKLDTAFYEEASFATSITGSWGTGKTTAFNFIKEDFKDKVDVIIDFYPWHSSSPEHILEDFIYTYKEKLTSFLPEISSELGQYLSLLSKSLSSCFFFGDGIEIISKALNNDIPLNKQYLKIKNVLSDARMKVVVFIDDLDRLRAKELMEVFRIIRNTANFPYTQFIVAYDKEYVVSQMISLEILNPENYLEKIFNLEIPLPKYGDYLIKENLYKKLMEFYGEEETQLCPMGFRILVDVQYEYQLTASIGKIEYLIPRMLKTNRDLIRFFNAFKLVYDTCKDKEIFFDDLFYLEMLRYKFKNIYDILRDDTLALLTPPTSDGAYELRKDLKNVLEETLDLDASSVKLAYGIMQILFKGAFKYANLRISNLDNNYLSSIKTIYGLPRYFAWNLSPENLSNTEFFKILPLNKMEEDSKEYKLLKSWALSKSKEEIIHRFSTYFDKLTNNLLAVSKSKGDFVKEERNLINAYKFFESCFDLGDDKIKEQFEDMVGAYFQHGVFYTSCEQFEQLLSLNISLAKVSERNIFIGHILKCIMFKTEIDNINLSGKDLVGIKEMVVGFLKSLVSIEKYQKDLSGYIEDLEKKLDKVEITEAYLLLGIGELKDIISSAKK